MPYRLVCIALVLFGASSTFAHEPSVMLASGQVPLTHISIGFDMGPVGRLAATELQHYLEQLGGPRLPIMECHAGPDSGAIVLRVRRDEDARAADESAFRLVTRDHVALVEGASEYAVLIGVYDLLERLGCRWLGPGAESLPPMDAVAIPLLDVAQTPSFRWRGLELISGSTPAIVDWMAKSKLNVVWPEAYLPHEDLTVSETSMQEAAVPDMIARGMTIFWGGHILPILMPLAKYSDHPEYFAEIDGTRLNPDAGVQERNQVCIANPEALRVLTENTIAFLRNHPWIDVLFLWAGDTTKWCECDACRKLLPDPDTPSAFGGFDRTALYTRMVKTVADGVEKALPGRRMAFNHYYNLEELPRNANGTVAVDVLPSRRVLSAVDDYHQCDRHPFADASCPRGKRIEPLAGMWGPHYDDTVSWSYYFAWNFTKGLPISQVSKIAEDFRFLRGLGITGLVDNVSLSPGTLQWVNNQPNFYAYAKAAWNLDEAPEDILGDFVAGWYGPCAGPMLDVWRLLETTTRRYGLDAEFMPADPALAAPDVVHGRMVDAPLPADSTPADDIRLLVPNDAVADRLLALCEQARAALGTERCSPYAFRRDALSSTLQSWYAGREPYAVFGFLNGGARYRNAIYEMSDSTITCTLVHGNNLGDAFWKRPLDAEQLTVAGDAAEVRVSIRMGTAHAGSPLYRSGPGLYHADSAHSVCGAPGAHNVTFFIGNQDDDQSGPRRVIVQVNDGAYGTALASSPDNAWDYGQEVALRIRYLDADAFGHAYEYAYDAGDGWREVATYRFATKLPFAAPSMHFAFLDATRVRYPLVDWARLSDFKLVAGR